MAEKQVRTRIESRSWACHLAAAVALALCVAPISLGGCGGVDLCEAHTDCRTGQNCSAQGVCKVCNVDGAACGDGDECCSDVCNTAGFCGTAGCSEDGAVCAQDSDCCTGDCDNDGEPFYGSCRTCIDDGQPCSFDEECCTAPCNADGFCGCSEDGAICAQDSDCCTGDCDNDGEPFHGWCRNPACIDDGQPCMLDEECCTAPCTTDGLCGPACVEDDLLCELDEDCCSGVCDADGYCGPTDPCAANAGDSVCLACLKSDCCTDYTGCSMDPECDDCLGHILDGTPHQDTCYGPPSGAPLYYYCAQEAAKCLDECYPDL